MRDDLGRWQHDHSFGQDRRQPGERRTRLVALLTVLAMVAEIAAGLAFGSMALLADGLHVGSHALALGIAAFAYAYARRHAHDRRFSFGTGKVIALGGYTGALLLVIFAVLMAWESLHRFLAPVPIAFDQAILVALAGLLVNAVSAAILSGRTLHGHRHDAGDHGRGHHHGHPGPHRAHDDESASRDLNLRGAYLHVLADALTSVLAIVALAAGKFWNATWLDPAMGILGALLIANWSRGLLRQTSQVLLDWQAPAAMRDRLCRALEADGSRVADLHVWAIGPGIYAAAVTVLSPGPTVPDRYHARVPADLGIVHMNVEVRPADSPAAQHPAVPPA